MAEQLLNMTGLTYFKQKLDAEYLKDADIAIKSVKVNGSALTPDAQKAIDVIVPEVYTEATGDNGIDLFAAAKTEAGDKSGITLKQIDIGATVTWLGLDGSSANYVQLASTNYVDTNGGKIDKIKVNDTEQTITNKEVNLKVPTITQTVEPNSNDVVGINFRNNTANDQCGVDLGLGENILTANLYNSAGARVNGYSLVTTEYVSANFRTEAQVQTAIENALAGVTEVRFEVVSTLPATGENGVFYLVPNAGATGNEYNEHIWVNKGTTENPNYVFENLGPRSMDLSNYVQQGDIEIITTAQIDALFT